MTPPVPQTLPDGRPVPLMTGEERAVLESWLAFHRATLELKCAGLDDAQVRTASAAPSELTLLGLVQHLAEVERTWFQRAVGGLDVPPVFGPDNATGYGLDPGRGIGDALAVWRREVARGQEVCAGLSLESVGRVAEGFMAGAEVALRWVLVHLIEEYARHNGHADILRERLDGATGA
ncbi:hypothetical protein SZN_21956 [Streptomyces zinciresistens K42]|uniref:Mini-circle protein n=1 Tax=Streptomyces zinciresistens K42 TaxID=700597 RepID=G2GFV7_9ACTN|nr:DinB family protein [Streptomyces zinciresistens]EGX57585.1 hypothetical protein SZN_21956 [Streptomyces zinciresistens K42]